MPTWEGAKGEGRGIKGGRERGESIRGREGREHVEKREGTDFQGKREGPQNEKRP